jgi:hypothetical protein
MESALVSQFMDVTVCTSQTFAMRQLSSCQWNVEKAINLLFAGGGHVADAAPPSLLVEDPPAMLEENEVRAPLPVGAERLYEDLYYGSCSRIDRSPWAAPRPKPVPVQGLSASEIQASGWGLEEEKFEDSQQAHGGVIADGLSSVEDYGLDNDEGQDGEDEEVDALVNYNKDDDEEEQADDDINMEYYGLETDDEDEVYFDALMDVEVQRDQGDQPPSPPPSSLTEFLLEAVLNGMTQVVGRKAITHDYAVTSSIICTSFI